MTLKRWCKPKNPSSWIDFMHFSKLLPLKLTKFCYQKMAIVWSWMARHFQIILIVEKRPKKWKLFKTLFSKFLITQRCIFFTMPITCRKGRRHFHICGIKTFWWRLLCHFGHHFKTSYNWQKVTKNWVIDWLLTTKVLSVYGGGGGKMMIWPTCPSFFTMATQIRIFYYHHVVIYIADLDLLEEVL